MYHDIQQTNTKETMGIAFIELDLQLSISINFRDYQIHPLLWKFECVSITYLDKIISINLCYFIGRSLFRCKLVVELY